ncbi:MAG: hypothetical protein AAFV93_22795 [Chloroflexota bacterium]
MIQGVIQRLSIAEQTASRLVLRELPLLDWGAGFLLVIVALMLSINSFWTSAVLALAIALYFLLAGRVRLIEFDISAGTMQIHYQTPLKRNTVNTIKLETIQRAYLYTGDDDGTQIILVRRDGEELGISVYSDDIASWKEPIVVAVNAILYEAHKDKRATSEVSISTEKSKQL